MSKNLTAFEIPDQPGMFKISGHQKKFSEAELLALMRLAPGVQWVVITWQDPRQIEN